MTAATTETVIDPFLTEEFHTDPNAVIARMRAEDPVHQISGLGAWMVTRYDDVRALFDQGRFVRAASRGMVRPETARPS